ncbi:MAG: 16S rRNA (adenine(1518)-N(6)/adenine(1519)-N(6))-dimethyltransferase RsmA [Candidatus Micrarchaeota archaeon]|nr:16S rRNA (adenine(1518)-N(6)/adenine(1519)-N(6))-dimethyltransferase RsmA [Candidatus Micrarchaeota archaeon]
MKAALGQNFLVDEAVLTFEAKLADVKGKSVLEIGAGDGRLTAKLLSCGAGHITAVEYDHKLAKKLRIRFQRQPRVKVMEEDFMKFDESARYNCITGNIPYYITSPIIFKIAKMNFDRTVLCVQKEFAERMVAEPGSRNYGRLSVSSQSVFEVEILAYVPRTAFEPAPKVDSCLISLTRKGAALEKGAEKTIAAVFSHRKKSLKNAVVDARMELFGTKDKKVALLACQNLKYADRKVFTLTPDEAKETVDELEAYAKRADNPKKKP